MITADDTTQADTAVVPSRARYWRTGLLVALLLVVGVVARSIAVDGSDSMLLRWLPWMGRTPITLYYADPSGEALAPVSRTVSRDDISADTLVAELLAGPAAGTGLHPLLPGGTTASAVTLSAGTLSVDFTGDPAAFADPLVAASLRHSLLSWSAVTDLVVTVDGVPVDVLAAPGHLVFFWDESRDLLVARPTTETDPRQVLTEYLAGPGTPGLVGLPDDVRLITYDFNPGSGLLSLDFSYVPSVRTFALDHPEGMRRVLEGLIATMTTGFPQVGGLYIDFEGQATLGLGQCADLLRTLQLQPEVLNDERLLARVAS